MPAARHRRLRPDRGSAAAELVLVTPLLIAVLMLIVAAGRLVDGRLQVESAAMQAARAASLARTPAAAAAAATETAEAALASEHITCSPLAIDPDTSDFTPGGDVSVTVTCTVSLAGLSLLHIPGSQSLTSSFTSPIDTYRGDFVGSGDSEGLPAANLRVVAPGG
jgi:Flp pilus assembly protein TadG